jgi:hypothetical protein
MRSSLFVFVFVGILLCQILVLSGCFAPDGGAWPTANGTFTYYSTTDSPKTISIMDSRTEEAFFTMELPVGEQLTFKFLEGGGNDVVLTPDRMQWAIFPLGTGTGRLTNQMTVPPATARRIQIALRDTPEWPEAEDRYGLVLEGGEASPDHLTPRGGRLPSDVPIYDQ